CSRRLLPMRVIAPWRSLRSQSRKRRAQPRRRCGRCLVPAHAVPFSRCPCARLPDPSNKRQSSAQRKAAAGAAALFYSLVVPLLPTVLPEIGVLVPGMFEPEPWGPFPVGPPFPPVPIVPPSRPPTVPVAAGGITVPPSVPLVPFVPLIAGFA